VKAAHGAAALATFASVIVMLFIPYRLKAWPTDNISATGSTPTATLRSPEDNLRPWQFLSVSWIAPLLSIGRERTLNEADVWLLGFQFQHRRLHEAFRVLKGSVLRRLCEANAIDFVIIGSISFGQLAGGK
jgi:hypothetical protein